MLLAPINNPVVHWEVKYPLPRSIVPLVVTGPFSTPLIFTFTEVTVPLLLVAPLAIPSNLVLSVALIKPAAEVVALECVWSDAANFEGFIQ